jgi:hypothetical protein
MVRSACKLLPRTRSGKPPPRTEAAPKIRYGCEFIRPNGRFGSKTAVTSRSRFGPLSLQDRTRPGVGLKVSTGPKADSRGDIALRVHWATPISVLKRKRTGDVEISSDDLDRYVLATGAGPSFVTHVSVRLLGRRFSNVGLPNRST